MVQICCRAANSSPGFGPCCIKDRELLGEECDLKPRQPPANKTIASILATSCVDVSWRKVPIPIVLLAIPFVLLLPSWRRTEIRLTRSWSKLLFWANIIARDLSAFNKHMLTQTSCLLPHAEDCQGRKMAMKARSLPCRDPGSWMKTLSRRFGTPH